MLRGSLQLKLFLTALSSAADRADRRRPADGRVDAAAGRTRASRRRSSPKPGSRRSSCAAPPRRSIHRARRRSRSDRRRSSPRASRSSRATAACSATRRSRSRPWRRWRITLTRPEIVAAARSGIGRAARYSATLGIDMLYVAAPVHHPQIAFVRAGAAADRRPPAAAGDPVGDAVRTGTGARRRRR